LRTTTFTHSATAPLLFSVLRYAVLYYHIMHQLEHGPGVSREAVAAERIRLEKERRVMADSDDELFYDLDDTTAVYEFDLRHRGPLKRGGVVRQVL
jgi:hypothetical protein